MQKIWVVKITENDSFLTKERLLKNLPESIYNRANRYLDAESSWSFITGRLLLKKVLSENKISPSLLEEIHYSDHGKPSFIDYNFSLSHSNWYVVLIFGTSFSVGIDIEKKKNIDLNLFKYLFTDLEWKSIITSENPLERFYWFWVRKEALLKAVGCALKDLKLLEVNEHFGIYKDKRYLFKTFDFDSEFNGVVAMEDKIEVEVKHIQMADLLDY